MAKELTEEELCGVRDLEENFSEHLERYRLRKVADLQSGDKTEAELRDELKGLEEYLEGCRRSEIDDLLVNIEFYGAKVGVLKRILGIEV